MIGTDAFQLLLLRGGEAERRVGTGEPAAQAIAVATTKTLGHFDAFAIEDGNLAKALEQMTAEAQRRKHGR